MTYEDIIKTLESDKKMSMGTMMRLQRSLGKKIASLSATEEDIAKMTPDEQVEHQLNMLEVITQLVYIAMGSPKDMTPEDIAELIPFDKAEELSGAVGKYMNQASDIKKN